ncbi:MAG: hypothetical protein QXZ43_03755 [Candidatus Aenigmatarchaeota archaeon]
MHTLLSIKILLSGYEFEISGIKVLVKKYVIDKNNPKRPSTKA